MEFIGNKGQDCTLNAGDTVEYATFGGGIREVKVTDVLENVKNGFPGFDGVIVGTVNDTVWGYTDQIRKVNGEEV
jgi:hypothetical protein